MSFLDKVTDSYKKRTAESLSKLQSPILSDLVERFSGMQEQQPQIGSLGDIVFTVTRDEMRTFRNYRRSTKARFASHEIIGKKPIIEYIAPEGEEITFAMQFHVGLGVSPAEETAKLRELCERGEPMYLVLGNEPVGAYMWVIESLGESAERIDHGGRILMTQVEITLKEYLPEMHEEPEGEDADGENEGAAQ